MIVVGEKDLRHECESVASALEGLEIADKLKEELINSSVPGIGLAANQIGINKKVFIMDIPDEKYSFSYTFVNPVIVYRSEPMIFKEGCLSFPGEEVVTFRYNKVVVEDLLEPCGREFAGLAAVVVQHEIDHLNQIVMHDRKVNRIKFNEPCLCGSGNIFKECCIGGLKNRGF